MMSFEIHFSEQEIEAVSQVALDKIARREEHVRRFARPEERNAVGLEIDPDSARVFFEYAEVLDPYGDTDIPEECSCVGREFFAVDPDRGVAVSFRDLPVQTRTALAEKQHEADARGWEFLLRAVGDIGSGPSEDS